MEPDANEIRVLGCLIEKQRTTPDAYPLTLNALRLACNQSTNRDPVLELDDGDVRAALERLGRRGFTRNASWSGSRAMKYKQALGEALELSEAQLAVLCLLMLRGPQTAAELRTRGDRLHSFAEQAEVEQALEQLEARGLAEQLPRRPGERGRRFAQRLGEGQATGVAESQEQVSAPTPEPGDPRVAELEHRLERLEAEVARLRDELGA